MIANIFGSGDIYTQEKVLKLKVYLIWNGMPKK